MYYNRKLGRILDNIVRVRYIFIVINHNQISTLLSLVMTKNIFSFFHNNYSFDFFFFQPELNFLLKKI